MQENNGASSYHRYLEGNKEAFNDIIHLYKKGLIGFIYRYAGDVDVAEDISEDCFVELIVNPQKYKMESNLKTYLYGIAHNKIKQYFRRKRVVSYVSIEDVNELFSSDNTSNDIIKSETQTMIYQALSVLPKDYCEVLYLHYFEDMSYEDIGKVMRKNTKQVYNLASRAKKKLKENLEKDGFVYEEQ